MTSAFLSLLASFLISPTFPAEQGIWFSKGWNRMGPALVLEATSEVVLSKCEKNAFISFPTVIQAKHSIEIDGKIQKLWGFSDSNYGASSYARMDIPCAELPVHGIVTWKVSTTTHSFAQISEWPVVTSSLPLEHYLSSTALILSAGSLLFLGIVSCFFFAGVLPREIPVSVAGSCFAFATCFCLLYPEGYGILLDEVILHKSHDVFLLIAMIFIWNLYRLICGVPLYIQRFQVATAVGGILIIFIAKNLDESQIGTCLGFVGSLACLLSMFAIQTRKLLSQKISRSSIFQFFSIAIFCGTAVNEILINLSLIDGYPLFSLGSLATMFTLSLAANEKVVAINHERDYLREKLQHEVEEKTKDLSRTLDDLKRAQAELVNSAKLASVGTLSAGIAHEINNSLNFVNGAIKPLEKIICKDEITPSDKSKIATLMKMMQEGLSMTLEIISNLKRHLGTSQVNSEAVDVADSINGILVLFTSKLKNLGIEVKVDIKERIEVYATRVMLSQVLMNLLSNSIDALSSYNRQGKKIEVESHRENNLIYLSFKDNGPGIPKHVIDRIFEPFFTTKDVGVGTGLGLHIVHSEMKKLGGDVKVFTEIDQGTTFILTFPASCEFKEVA